MESQLSKLKRYMASGQFREALRLAAGWSDLGDHREAITKARAADVWPLFYVQIGQDPAAIVAAGIEALKERYPLERSTMSSKKNRANKPSTEWTPSADVDLSTTQAAPPQEGTTETVTTPETPPTVQPVTATVRKTAPYHCGQILKKHGIESGVTSEMIDEYCSLSGKPNRDTADANLSWALRVVQVFIAEPVLELGEAVGQINRGK